MLNKDKIKVLFRHRSMEMGGVEKVLLSMLNNLNKEKFNISVNINLHQGELRNALPKDIHTTFLAKGKEDFSANKLLGKVQLALRAAKLSLYRKLPFIVDDYIIKNNADIEIATSYTMFADVLNSSNKKSKKIGWFHSDITSPGLIPILPKLIEQIKQFDYFIFGSAQAQDIFKKTYPNILLPPHQTILNTIPIEEIKEKSNATVSLPKTTHYPSFTSVGRLHNRKGYHLLANVHKQLIDDGFFHEIFVIGDGEEFTNLYNQIEELKITNTFHLLGTSMNPYPFVKQSDYYIMSSRSEGWPLIIAETLILQKPIIATNVGGIPEMITHKKNGYLVDYSEQGMYNGMKEFLTNKELVEDIKTNLLDSEKQFNNQKIFDSVENILIETYKKQC